MRQVPRTEQRPSRDGTLQQKAPLQSDETRLLVAYNRWSCPLTPAENRRKVAVRAGEKVFHIDSQS